MKKAEKLHLYELHNRLEAEFIDYINDLASECQDRVDQLSEKQQETEKGKLLQYELESLTEIQNNLLSAIDTLYELGSPE